jgi:hypothetical protein
MPWNIESRGACTGRLRVVTLNLGFHLPWEERRSAIVRGLDKIDADLVLLKKWSAQAVVPGLTISPTSLADIRSPSHHSSNRCGSAMRSSSSRSVAPASGGSPVKPFRQGGEPPLHPSELEFASYPFCFGHEPGCCHDVALMAAVDQYGCQVGRGSRRQQRDRPRARPRPPERSSPVRRPRNETMPPAMNASLHFASCRVTVRCLRIAASVGCASGSSRSSRLTTHGSRRGEAGAGLFLVRCCARPSHGTRSA